MVRQIAVILLNICAMSAAGILASCSYSGSGGLEKGRTMPERTIEQVQEEHMDAWMAIPGVEGTLQSGFPKVSLVSRFFHRENHRKYEVRYRQRSKAIL